MMDSQDNQDKVEDKDRLDHQDLLDPLEIRDNLVDLDSPDNPVHQEFEGTMKNENVLFRKY